VDLLLKKGAIPSAKTADGKTPADLAAEQGHKKIASVLS